MEECHIYTALSRIPSMDAGTIERIVASFEELNDLATALPDDFSKKTGLPISLSKNIIKHLKDSEEYYTTLIDKLKKSDSHIITYKDSDYPPLLKMIPDAPPVLYCKGNLSDLQKCIIAVVGARKADAYGLEAAFRLSRKLCEYGFTVVSGMARGIDGSAHRGALAAKGRTVAVLGSGIDVIYPKEHSRLYNEIAKTGAIITEFPPESQPITYHFPLRNRIIAGMVSAVVVVQADIRSGSLHTVNRALNYGREVMAVPGSIFSHLSKGTNLLIKEGAPMIESAEDVLSFLGINFEPQKKEKNITAMSDIETKVYSLLDGVISSYELAETSGLSASELYKTLSFLEFKGFIKSSGGGVYIKTEQ